MPEPPNRMSENPAVWPRLNAAACRAMRPPTACDEERLRQKKPRLAEASMLKQRKFAPVVERRLGPMLRITCSAEAIAQAAASSAIIDARDWLHAIFLGFIGRFWTRE